jgi:hypothetical protein
MLDRGSLIADPESRIMLTGLWASSRPLTAVGLLMMALTPLLLVATAVDPRIITGMPAWLKPAKFAVSLGVSSLTMAWILQYLPERRRLRGVVGWVTALVFVIELAIISTQAWRGTTSHFNVGMPLDAALFGIMGAAIVIQTLMTIAVTVALWAQSFEDRAFGWALRFGLTLSVLGASVGGLMTQPTEAQIAEYRASRSLSVSGAHTVGAPDGGPGLPGTGWSLEHGDLRVPHFVGLHAMQVLPLAAMLLVRRRADAVRRVRLILAASASYTALFGILLWQALRAQSIVAPDTRTMAAVSVWGALSIAAFAWLGKAGSGHRTHSERTTV